MILEITNPHDRYTIVADDWRTACAAVILMGQGQYGLRQVDGNKHMPILLFGASWVIGEFGVDGKELISSCSPKDLADVLSTIVIGDRDEYEKSGMQWKEWHKEHLTSCSDVGRYTQFIVEKLREFGSEWGNDG